MFSLSINLINKVVVVFMREITQANLKVNEGTKCTVYIPIKLANRLDVKATKVLEEVDKQLALYNQWKFEQLAM